MMLIVSCVVPAGVAAEVAVGGEGHVDVGAGGGALFEDDVGGGVGEGGGEDQGRDELRAGRAGQADLAAAEAGAGDLEGQQVVGGEAADLGALVAQGAEQALHRALAHAWAAVDEGGEWGRGEDGGEEAGGGAGGGDVDRSGGVGELRGWAAVAGEGDGGGVVAQLVGEAEAGDRGEHGAGVVGVEAAAQGGAAGGEGGEDQGAVGQALRARRRQLGVDRAGGRAHADARGWRVGHAARGVLHFGMARGTGAKGQVRRDRCEGR